LQTKHTEYDKLLRNLNCNIFLYSHILIILKKEHRFHPFINGRYHRHKTLGDKQMKLFLKTVLATGILAIATSAHAAEPFKIGLILPMTGPFASTGKQINTAANLYMQQHGDTVAGRKIQLILKDDTGLAPEVTRRLAQELVVQDKVNVLAGFGLTPLAFAAAPVATQSKTPMVVMAAATSSIMDKSPYIVRTSQTVPQIVTPM